MVKKTTTKKVPTKPVAFDLEIIGTAVTADQAEARIRTCRGRHPMNAGGVCKQCGAIKPSVIGRRTAPMVKFELPEELAL